MRKSYKHFLSGAFSLILLSGMVAIVCFGQTGGLVNCREEDYDCRTNNYARMVDTACKGLNIRPSNDCRIAEQTRLIEANPSDAAAYFNRGKIYEFAGDSARALDDFNKALELHPQFTAAYLSIAWLHVKKKEYNQELTALNKAIEIDPKLGRAYLHRGSAYHRKREFDKALADYSKAIELESVRGFRDVGYRGRASVYASLRDFDRALADYNKALEIYPHYWLNYYDRGLIYWRLGEKEKAEADCQKAKELKRRQPIRERPMTNEYCSL